MQNEFSSFQVKAVIVLSTMPTHSASPSFRKYIAKQLCFTG